MGIQVQKGGGEAVARIERSEIRGPAGGLIAPACRSAHAGYLPGRRFQGRSKQLWRASSQPRISPRLNPGYACYWQRHDMSQMDHGRAPMAACGHCMKL